MHIGIDASRCAESQATGVERYASLLLPPLVSRLNEQGHRVTLYSRKPLPTSLTSARKRFVGIPRFWTHLGLGPAAIFDGVERLFVSSHVLPLMRPKYCIVFLHDACFEKVPQAYSLAQRWYLRLTAADALRSARVITHSAATRRDFIQIFQANPSVVSVVPPAAVPLQVESVDLPWQKPYFLCIGRLETRKNIGTLLHAFDTLLTKRPQLPHSLVLMGMDGYGAREIKKLHGTLRFSSRVILRGYVDDKIRDEALRLSAGVVLPSLCEGTSLVLLEARAAGVPFAASGHPACREAGGGKGIYVSEVTRKESWVEALEQLVDNPQKPEAAPLRSWDEVAHDVAEIITA